MRTPWTTLRMLPSVFLLAALLHAPRIAAAANPFAAPSCNPVFQDTTHPDSVWSGSRSDLEAIVDEAKANYGHFEDSTHLGRNATMLVPATRGEMEREIALGNSKGWDNSFWDGAHAASANSDDSGAIWALKAIGSGVVKYVNSKGDEVVYNKETGQIVSNEKLGTHNYDTDNSFASATWGGHQQKDMAPNKTKADPNNSFERDGDQYKYVGILYERDPNDPNKFYLVDGQTGKRMTNRQAKEFPTTLSDMWKDKGLICVANDSETFEQTPTSTVNTEPALSAEQPTTIQTPSGTANLSHAFVSPKAETLPPISKNRPAPVEDDHGTDDSPSVVMSADPSGKTPRDVAIAWLQAYNARNIGKMVDLSVPEFAEGWKEENVAPDAFPEPLANWRNATVNVTSTTSRKVSTADADLAPIEIGVDCICTGADSTSYEAGLFIVQYKSSGLFKVELAITSTPE